MPKHLVDLPRTAVFTTWGSTQDVGWVRYALDQFEVGYDLIYKAAGPETVATGKGATMGVLFRNAEAI